MDISEARKIENQNLKEAIKKMPRFFETPTFTDNQDYLEKYGIFIPEKKRLSQGYLKLRPQDFIMEEIFLDGELQTIFPDKFLHKTKDFLPEDPIIYATLVKCGLSTIEVAEELAKNLKIEPEAIKYAGIKDKYAITSQLISIKNTPAEKIHQIAASHFFIKNVFSGEKEIYFGALKGNQFTILIRTSPDFQKDIFLKNLEEIKRNGFYNFFYLQRFGVPRLINPYCGLCVLKGDYEGAIKTAICQPGEREFFYFRSLRKDIKKIWGNWEEMEGIFELFPFTFRDEKKMISYLIKKPGDFEGVLSQVPKVVQLWLTSFTAFLFNQKLSSYSKMGEKPPREVPLVLSSEKRDWLFYEDLLKENGVFSITFALKSLKPFTKIYLRHQEQRTIERVEILNYKILPGGVILKFNLPKDCYPNTFLSHLFNLITGKLPEKFSKSLIDVKANLKEPSLEEVLNKFSTIVS